MAAFIDVIVSNSTEIVYKACRNVCFINETDDLQLIVKLDNAHFPLEVA